jgi:aspartyl/glutamyl-tRNA(Asn/Gln) amidotransferase C subunit
MTDSHSVRIPDLRNAAHLARLDLAEEEAVVLCGEVARILEHFAALQAVPVAGVEPCYTAVGTRGLPPAPDLREDNAQASLPRAALLELAPQTQPDDEFYRVPKAIGGAP